MKSIIMIVNADSLLTDLSNFYECKITDSLDEENKLIISHRYFGRFFKEDFYTSLSFNIKKFETIRNEGTSSSKYILLGRCVYEKSNTYKDVDPERLVQEVFRKYTFVNANTETINLANNTVFVTDFALCEKCEFDNLEDALI